MDSLPIEIWIEVFKNLDFKTKCKVRQVCTKWNAAVTLSMRSLKVLYIGYGQHDLAKLAPWMDDQQLKAYAKTELNTIHLSQVHYNRPLDKIVLSIGKVCPNLDALLTNREVSLDVLARALGSRLVFFAARTKGRWKRKILRKFKSLAQLPMDVYPRGPCTLTALEQRIPLKLIRVPCEYNCRRCLEIQQEQLNRFPADLHTLEWKFYPNDGPVDADFSRISKSLEALNINPYSFNLNSNFPDLKRLTVSMFHEGDRETMDKVLKFISHSPKLQSISMQFDDLGDTDYFWMKALVFLKNVRSLRSQRCYRPYGTDEPYDFYPALVSLCPLLEELEFSSMVVDERVALFLTELQRLKNIRVCNFPQESLICYLANLHPNGPKEIAINADYVELKAMSEPLHDVIRLLAQTGRIRRITMDFSQSGSACTDQQCPARRVIRVPVHPRPFPCLLGPFRDLHEEQPDYSSDLLWQ